MKKWLGLRSYVSWVWGGDQPRPAPAAAHKQYGVQYDHKGGRVVAMDPARVGYATNQRMRTIGGGSASAASPDAHSQYDMSELSAHSAVLDKDNGIYQGSISRILSFVLGDGWTFEAQTGDDATNAAVKALHDREYKWPEVRSLDDEFGFQKKLLRHMLVDPFVLLLKNEVYGKLQFVSPERVLGCVKDSNPQNGNRIVNGVELNAVGRVAAFWIGEWDKYGLAISNPVRVDAANTIFWAQRRRFDQTAGEPLGQASFGTFAQLDDVCANEAWSWQLLSRIAMTMKGKGAPQLAGAMRTDQGRSAKDGVDKVSQVDTGGGLVFATEDGELTPLNYQRPSANFEQSVKMYLRLIGMQLGLSLEFMLLIWSDTNYSSGRASHASVTRNTRDIVNGLLFILNQAHKWDCQRWLSNGEITVDVETARKHEYHLPPYFVLDPGKEAEANQVALKTGQLSFGRFAQERGMTRDDLFAERSADFATAAAIVAKHNAAYPDNSEAQITIADVLGFGGDPIPPTPAPDANAGTIVGSDGTVVQGGMVTALNGAQITAVVGVVQQYQSGVLSHIAAVELLIAVGIRPEIATKIMDSIPHKTPSSDQPNTNNPPDGGNTNAGGGA